MRITTVVDFLDDEEYGRKEVTTFSREVGELDIQDAMWYFRRAFELAGFDVDQLHVITSDGRLHKTDF